MFFSVCMSYLGTNTHQKDDTIEPLKTTLKNVSTVFWPEWKKGKKRTNAAWSVKGYNWMIHSLDIEPNFYPKLAWKLFLYPCTRDHHSKYQSVHQCLHTFLEYHGTESSPVLWHHLPHSGDKLDCSALPCQNFLYVVLQITLHLCKYRDLRH